MEFLYVLGWGFAIIAPIILFFMNNRQAERLDRMENENRVQFSNLARLEQLYTALLASRHQPGSPVAPPAAPAPVAPVPPTPPTVPVPPEALNEIAPQEGPPVAPAAANDVAPLADPVPAIAEPPPPSQPVAPASVWATARRPAAESPPALAPMPPPASGASPLSLPVQVSVSSAHAMAVSLPAKKPFNWERFLGVQLPIWLGAIALSLAGFFFVRYIIDAGLFTPLFRIIIGVIVAIAFLGIAEFIRRSRLTNAPQIAAALAAASIATLYACSYYASVGFGLIPESAGFVAMALVTILAIGIALVFGRVVAVVGLIGGYVAPALFASADPSAFVLFGYLTVILVGIFVLIRMRDWWAISLPALLGPLIWMMAWASLEVGGQVWAVASFAVLVPLVVVAAASEFWRAADAPLKITDAHGRPATAGAALAGAFAASGLGLFILVADAGQPAPYWYALGALAVIAVALAYHRPLLLGWLQLLPLAATVLACLAWREPSDGSAWIIGIVALIHAAGAIDQFRRLQRPVLWAAVLTFIAVFFYSFAMFRLAGWHAVAADKHYWAFGALVLAGAMLALLWFFGRGIDGEVARNRVYAVLGGGASAFLSLLVVIEFDATYFPLAAALMILGLSYIHHRAPLRGLQIVTAIYLAIYGLLVLGAGSSIYVDPVFSRFLLTSANDTPFLTLVVPGILFFAAASLFHWSKAETLSGFLDVIGLVAVAWGLLVMVVPDFGAEFTVGAYVLAAKILNPEMVLAALAIAAGRFLGRQTLYLAGMVFAGLVALGVLAGSVLPVYQFWPWLELPGWGIFNVALLALGTPALILLGIGWFLRQDSRVPVANYGRGLSVFGVVTLFTLMLIEIRHVYHPKQLQGATSSVEFYSYSLGMLLFGVALLVIGVAIQNRGSRMLSFVFVLGAVVKVFLWDAGGLDGLWRVLSFFGMGLCLLAISWLYARFVFGLTGRTAEPLAATPAQ
jgi:uncharacterized membrane protein